MKLERLVVGQGTGKKNGRLHKGLGPAVKVWPRMATTVTHNRPQRPLGKALSTQAAEGLTYVLGQHQGVFHSGKMTTVFGLREKL